MPIGLIAGFFYAGVGFVPHDLHFETHVFFANYAFLALFLLCILHSITVYYSRLLSNNYTLGYICFCLILFIYLRIIFFGPKDRSWNKLYRIRPNAPGCLTENGRSELYGSDPSPSSWI